MDLDRDHTFRVDPALGTLTPLASTIVGAVPYFVEAVALGP